MNQGEEAVNNIRTASLLQKYKGRYDDKVVALVKSDWEYGLSEEDTKTYLDKGYSLPQMKIFSECLREGGCGELIGVLQEASLSEYQMQVAVEFYKKGVAIEHIREVTVRKETPAAMRKAFTAIQEKLKEAVQAVKREDLEYVKSLADIMEKLVNRIGYTEKRYDTLNEKLSEFAKTKADDDIREHLMAENAKKDDMLSSQQDQIMQAGSEIEKLKKELAEKKEEIRSMKEQLKEMEHAAGKVASDSKTINTPVQESTDMAAPGALPYTVPVYYQVPIQGLHGGIAHVLVEKAAKKRESRAGLLARFAFKKKSRADIVRLVASGDFVPAQLVQIKNAIEQGLTESQLLELINNHVPAEKMKEIIEIAVLENSLEG